MDVREKLVELINQGVEIYSDGYQKKLTAANTIADHLIANGVTVQKHGRWEPREDLIGFVRCSSCNDCNIYDEWPDGKKWQYCPNCGARMDDA